MLKKREVILFKKEVTYNTDPTPVAGDAVLVEGLSWSNESLRMHERAGPKNTMGPLSSVFGYNLRTVSFDLNVKGSGAAGTAPECGALLQAAGFDEDIVASTSVTYAPLSTGIASGTLYYYADGLLRKLTGCRATVSFNMEAGGMIKASFTVTGHDAGTTDAALITPTYDSTVPPVAVSAPFTWGGYSAVISKLSFDMGNAMSMPADVSAADGYGEIRITDRNVTGSFDPEATLKATKDWESFVSSNSTVALTTGAIGGTAGNIVTIDMPACRATDISAGDRDGISTYEMPFQAVESAGDDNVAIAFT